MSLVRHILLTGGTGFLGSSLLRKLLVDPEVRVTVLKRTTSRTDRVTDLLESARISWFDLDRTDLPQLFAHNDFDTIIHCATNYGRGETDILDIVSANLLLPLTLLQLGLRHSVRTFVNTDTIIDKRVNNYSLSKKQFLDWLLTCSEKMQCVNLALEHFYGPFDDERKFTTMVFHKLMRNEESIALTRGEQKRHFIHIADVVRAFQCVLAHLGDLPRGFSSFEVSTESSITIRDFVETAKRLAGNTVTRLDFGAVPYRANELMDCQTDIFPLRALGWTPQIDLEAGIRQTLAIERTKLSCVISSTGAAVFSAPTSLRKS